MIRRLAASLLAVAALMFGQTMLVAAYPTAAMDASPEIDSYPCYTHYPYQTWTVVAAGSSWRVVNFGDGTSSPSQSINTTWISHTFPTYSCTDFTQTFRAYDNGGGTATDYTRFVVSY